MNNKKGNGSRLLKGVFALEMCFDNCCIVLYIVVYVVKFIIYDNEIVVIEK